MTILRRRADHPSFSLVDPNWKDETVVLIAGGPSVTVEQVGLAERAHAAGRVRCIVVNDAYLLAPWADLLYAADAHWWRWHQDGLEKKSLGLTAAQVAERFAAFQGERCAISNSVNKVKMPPGVHVIANAGGNVHGDGLSLKAYEIFTGRHSGFQAINVAVLAGAKTLLLLGYDGRAAKDGRTHWFGEHPRPTPPAIFGEIKKSFAAVEKLLRQAGVTVINCSPGSAIDAFPKMVLEDVLKFDCVAAAG